MEAKKRAAAARIGRIEILDHDTLQWSTPYNPGAGITTVTDVRSPHEPEPAQGDTAGEAMADRSRQATSLPS